MKSNRLFLIATILLISALFFIGTIAPVLTTKSNSTVANPDFSAEIYLVDGGSNGGSGTCSGSGC